VQLLHDVTEDSHGPCLAQRAAWVAETEGGIGGIAGFAILDVAGATVWALFVAPEAEGLGIGPALLARLLEGAVENGLTRLSLSTDPGTPSRALL
jgi:GNAT superfamily N-acetyltransferase